jgi:hypothetical protein
LPSVCHPSRAGHGSIRGSHADASPLVSPLSPGGWALSFVLAMYLTIPGIKNIGLFKNLADWKVDNTLAIQLSKW